MWNRFRDATNEMIGLGSEGEASGVTGRLRQWASPLLIFLCLLVVALTGWLTLRQRSNLAELQRHQLVLELLNEQLDLVYLLEAQEADRVVSDRDTRRQDLYRAIIRTQYAVETTVAAAAIPSIEVRNLRNALFRREGFTERLRSQLRNKRGQGGRYRFSQTARIYERGTVREIILRMTDEQLSVLKIVRNERERQTDLASYLVITVVALLTVLGFAASRERSRSIAEKAEQMQREAAERLKFQQVIESLGDGFLALDPDDRFTFVNPAAESMLGRTTEELIGAEVTGVFPAIENSELTRQLRRAKEERVAASFIFTTPSGRRTLLLRAHPYQDGLAVHVRDVSEERRLEASSRRDQALTEAVVRDVPYGVVLTDDTGAVRRINAAARTLRGAYEAMPDLDTWFAEAGRPDRRLPFLEVVKTAQERGAGVEERTLHRPDGSSLEVQLAVTRIADAEGGYGYALVISDVTAQRQARAAIEKSRDAAIALAKAKSEFLANMSHEIRTPLNGVLGIAEILSRTDLDDEQREHLRILRSSGQVLLRVINDVLDISKIEAGKMSIAPTDIDLPAAIDESVRLFEGAAREKGLRISIEGLTALPPRAYVDSVRLKQIVGNLLANAIKFSNRGTVSLSCSVTERENGERLRISVTDQGIGIPPERMDSIFDSFSQAEGSHARRYGGTGLGLTISKRLTELMKGTISVQSTPGVGSTFTIDIPLQLPVEGTTSPGREEFPHSLAISVLVAEDNETNVLVARHHLQALGCSVRVVGNGVETLAALEDGRYDIVLMDVHMPEMDGLEATRRWREIERSTGRRLPIYALTASALSEDVQTCLDAGMNGVLHKPYTRAELLATLQAATGSVEIPNRSATSTEA